MGTAVNTSAAPGRRRAGRPAKATRAQIIEAARVLTDREGPAVFTMAELAESLDIGVMTLYRHFPSKEALLGAVVYGALAELPALDESLPWDEALVLYFQRTRRLLLQHPSFVSLLNDRSVDFAEGLDLTSSILHVLLTAGVPPDRVWEVFQTLRSYTLGRLAWENSSIQRVPKGSFWNSVLRTFRRAKDPTLRMLAEATPRLDPDDVFAAGLHLILRGIATTYGLTSDRPDRAEHGSPVPRPDGLNRRAKDLGVKTRESRQHSHPRGRGMGG